MDPLFMACSFFRRRKFDQCIKLCTEILEKNAYDQSAWVLKMRALTEQVYMDETEMDDIGIAEMLDENAIAQIGRPGTSYKTANQSQNSLSIAMRPISQSGRPLSGAIRPGTQSSQARTMEQALKIPRSGYTARPLSSMADRYVRLGTASMLSSSDQFINVARLNFHKYSQIPYVAKPLFEYIFHHETDLRNALQLASLATEACQFNDWWWKVQLGKCYIRFGLFRDAEKQFASALRENPTVDIYLFLSKVCSRIDQPLNSINKLKEGNQRFPFDTFLLQGIARVYEDLGEMDESMKFYKEVLNSDGTNIEAVANIAANYFYSDQPEVALKFYRRLMQMGVYNSEIFNNIGLCCFYSQQYDMIIACFERALSLASTDQQLAEIWYNAGHVAIGVGDSSLAYQCFRLCLVYNNDCAEAYNNLGILECNHERNELARSFFQAAQTLNPLMFEPHFNYGNLAYGIGDLQSSYQALTRASELFPGHASTKELLKDLQEKFSVL